MGRIIRRGTKEKPRFYLKYVEADGTERTRAAKGAVNREQARRQLAEIERNVFNGKLGIEEPAAPDPEEQRRQTITVRELGAMFLGDIDDVAGYASPAIKSLELYRRNARTVLKVRIGALLGARSASAVSPADVERFRDALALKPFELAPASVVQALAVLSKLYVWARKAGHVDCANPAQGIERPRMNASIDYLDRAEVSKLLTAAAELERPGVASLHTLMLHTMIATAIYTGMRKGELFGLRWIDIHDEAARIDVMRSYKDLPKSGKPRHLPLHPELARILRLWKARCPAMPEALVFPTIGGDRGHWHMGEPQDTLGLGELLTAAGCHAPADGHPWHMLRHTFASHAVMSGTSLYELQQLLGHATSAMTQRYAHLAPDHMAAAIARLSFAVPVPSGVADMDAARRERAGHQEPAEPGTNLTHEATRCVS